jgi:hypothetical protein
MEWSDYFYINENFDLSTETSPAPLPAQVQTCDYTNYITKKEAEAIKQKALAEAEAIKLQALADMKIKYSYQQRLDNSTFNDKLSSVKRDISYTIPYSIIPVESKDKCESMWRDKKIAYPATIGGEIGIIIILLIIYYVRRG